MKSHDRSDIIIVKKSHIATLDAVQFQIFIRDLHGLENDFPWPLMILKIRVTPNRTSIRFQISWQYYPRNYSDFLFPLH